jgi:exodeoxyribonuclease VII small subunit
MSEERHADELTGVGQGPTMGAEPPASEEAGMSAEPQSYESASARVEEIVRRLDSGQAGLRETLELVREGRSLIEFCARELDAVGGDLEELRLDELVARLEGDHGGGAS